MPLTHNGLWKSTFIFQVSKSCVSSAECGPASVGCIPVDTQQVRNSEFFQSILAWLALSFGCSLSSQPRTHSSCCQLYFFLSHGREEEAARPGEINSVISFQICISCCDLSYCNIESPTNATNAIFSRKRRAKSKSKRKRPGRNGVEGSRFYGGGALWLMASLFYAYHCWGSSTAEESLVRRHQPCTRQLGNYPPTELRFENIKRVFFAIHLFLIERNDSSPTCILSSLLDW